LGRLDGRDMLRCFGHVKSAITCVLSRGSSPEDERRETMLELLGVVDT
jgi:hypothetical protein